MNITTPTVRPIEIINESEGECIEDMCSADSESVSEICWKTK